MSKHAQGPLEARPEHGASPGGLHMVVDVERSINGATVCTASYCTKADALLYAAAPKLLRALELALDCLLVGGPAQESSHAQTAIRMAREAIAEATSKPSAERESR